MLKELIQPSIKPLEPILEAGDPLFKERLDEAIQVLIYSRIDELSGDILDLLGHQFHIEGWELARTEQEKRALIKRAIELHRYKGTRWAVKAVLEMLQFKGEIYEWFQYGGQPYRFKVNITSTKKELNTETVEKLYTLINEYKNVRSWLEDLILTYLNKSGISYQTSNMAENFAEALLYFALEHSALTACYHQTSDMAEAGSYTEPLREFTFEGKTITWYQTACMGESFSYAVMQ